MPARGFTLLELLLVMLLLGLLLGLGALGIRQMDPGATGLREAVAAFLETSRDRARSSGRPVVVEVQPGDAEAGEPSRLLRRVWRRVLEGSFEPEFRAAQGLTLTGGAALGVAGRCGAALDLRQGGAAVVAGRGGVMRFSAGLSLDLDLRPETLRAADLVDWEDLLRLSLTAAAGVRAEVLVQVEDQALTVKVESPPGVLVAGRWQHLRLTAAGGVLVLAVDGEEVAREALSGRLPPARKSPLVGDAGGRFLGLLDELEVWTLASEKGPEFGEDVLVALTPPRVVFDHRGLLDVTVHPEPPRVELLDHGVPTGGFVVGRFTEEVGTP